MVQLATSEVNIVDRALRRHPQTSNYRFSVRDDQIEVFERVEPNLADMLASFGPHVVGFLTTQDPAVRPTGHPAGFRAILRFILEDPERRLFRVERIQHDAFPKGWIVLSDRAAIGLLVRRIIPLLGSKLFFELI